MLNWILGKKTDYHLELAQITGVFTSMREQLRELVTRCEEDNERINQEIRILESEQVVLHAAQEEARTVINNLNLLLP